MIILYSKNGCSQCDRAKALLESMGVEYNEIKIDQVKAAREFLVNKGHRSVPQLYVGGKLFVEDGFTGLSALSKEEIIEKVNNIEN